jgi:hypothetical protein
MFIAANFIILECALFHLMVPDIYDIYITMTCTIMLLMMLFKFVENLTKKKLKWAYKYLSRMKLYLLLSEW